MKKILKDKLSEYEENESKEILRRIVAAGDGVFLYAEKFCEEVNKGNIRLDDTRNYPDGLSGIYLGYFKRAFPDTEDYESSALPVLRAVLAAKESLPKNVLELVLLEENTDSFEDVEKKTALEAKKCCREALEKLASFLISSKKDGVECFSPYHKTLADWLSDEQRSGKFFADPKFGDVSLADTGMKCFKVLKMGGEHGSRLKKLFEMEELPKYFLIHLAWHLVDTGRYDEATRVLSDLNVFEEMYVYNEYMLGGCWRKVNERTGANPADCYGNAVKEKERDGWGKLNGGDVCNVMGVFF